MKRTLIILAVFILSACNTIDSNKSSSESSQKGNTNNGQSAALSYEVLFTKPYLTGGDDTNIRDKFVDLINSADKDATLRLSFYTVKQEEVIDALTEAHKRGVKVQVIYNGSMSGKNGHDKLLTAFNSNECSPASTESCVLVCNAYDKNKGCLGNKSGSKNHNKFATVSKLTTGEKHIVIQTSHNMTNYQLDKFNDMIVFNGNKNLYNDYNSYWGKQASMQTAEEYAKVTQIGPVTTYRYPFAKTDPVIDIFDTIDCSQPGGQLNVSVAFIRRMTVADKIKQMRDEGCNIKVVSDSLLSKSKAKKTIGKDVYKTTSKIHSKFMTVSGVDKATGQVIQKVLTGSHNFTDPALSENDETLLEINDAGLYKVYEEAFNEFYRSI